MSLLLRRYAFTVSASLALLAGCNGTRQLQSDIIPTDTVSHHSPTKAVFHVLRNFGRHFKRQRDRRGAWPEGGLLDVGGLLFGTATMGGGPDAGVVYTIDATGKYHALYRFHGYPDANGPTGTLTDLNGTLFGTSFFGGSCGAGTVYSITTSGGEKPLYSFCNGPASNPTGTLIVVKGVLYGTAAPSSDGDVYSITPSGDFKVLHEFTGGDDGFSAAGRLLNVNGTMYGLTYRGGSGTECGYGGCGVVYSITTSGKEKVLYSFQGGTDGWLPTAGLTDVNGTLYGVTTVGGGSGCNYNNGCGTIFSVTSNGIENVIYRFSGGSDGANPNTSLIAVNGTLYGTTAHGGSANDGTIFSVTTSGSEQVLHSFTGSEGSDPEGDLMELNGTLYGTTRFGGKVGSGCAGKGCGTVFALTP